MTSHTHTQAFPKTRVHADIYLFILLSFPLHVGVELGGEFLDAHLPLALVGLLELQLLALALLHQLLQQTVLLGALQRLQLLLLAMHVVAIATSLLTTCKTIQLHVLAIPTRLSTTCIIIQLHVLAIATRLSTTCKIT